MEIIKVREEIDAIENRCIIKRIYKARRFSFTFFDKPPARLIREKKKKKNPNA